MSKYQAFIDVSETWEEGEIDVISFIVEAASSKLAYKTAVNEINKGEHDEEIKNREVFNWDIHESDVIPEMY